MSLALSVKNWVRAKFQPLDADLTTIAGLAATTDNFIQAKSSAWASRTLAQVAADFAAAQADQETSTSVVKFVTPAVQQFHPSAAKCWAYVTVSAGTPTLQTSFNMTSITDTNVGILTVTIATDFSTVNWVTQHTPEGVIGFGMVAGGKTAGVAELRVYSSFAPAFSDPSAWNFAGYGDQ